MLKRNPCKYFYNSPEIIGLAVQMYGRSPLSLRNVEDLLHEQLSEKPFVTDVRNYGFAGAITLEAAGDEPLKRPFELAMAMWEQGVLVRYGGDTIQMAPHFVMPRPELERLVGTLSDCLDRLA